MLNGQPIKVPDAEKATAYWDLCNLAKPIIDACLNTSLSEAQLQSNTQVYRYMAPLASDEIFLSRATVIWDAINLLLETSPRVPKKARVN